MFVPKLLRLDIGIGIDGAGDMGGFIPAGL
jgi:hypothetical protein